MNKEYFKISSGLKNLIGSELITDNFVAIFELVKNSFDANASEVNITFENIYSSNAKIIIQDNGKGMDYNDLINKWLFVAYSAKKDKTEDFDYRNKIKSNRHYAGAKGVGRFSCDRLGQFLNLITIKNKVNSKVENINVNWKKFEENQNEEFIRIPVEHSVITQNKYGIEHGTILEISGISTEEWNRDELKKLKDKLSKLIRPDLNKSAKENPFNINIVVPDEIQNDINEKQKFLSKGEGHRIYRNTVNGKIENFIFEELDIKTTKIVTEISDLGDVVTTSLNDRENFIYTIKEKNKHNLLNKISIKLYFLNRSAKIIFKRRIGIDAVEYGNVFVYKNGFRIYPFGERNNDILGIDNRAVQGYNRYIGLRNLIGIIEIEGEETDLKETTSRDGGLVKTKAYSQLEYYLFETLKRLEKYVIDVTSWGVNDDNIENLNVDEVNKKLVKLIGNISDDKSILGIEYNKDLIRLISQQEENSAKKLVSNFKRIASETNNPKLLADSQKIERILKESDERVRSAEKETELVKDENKEIFEKLGFVSTQNNFLTHEITDDTKNLESILHHIGLTTNLIKSDIENLAKAINNNLDKNHLIEITKRISRQNEKITSFSKYFKKVNFNIHANNMEIDIITFTNEYLENVYKHREDLKNNRELLKINISTPTLLSLKIKFNPIDMIIVLDNLISNSFKNNASEIEVSWLRQEENSVILSFKDNGDGVKENVVNNIFDFGFSTSRRGSGLGLYHVKEIIEKLKSKIEVNNKLKKGVEFLISFKK
ncbi:ATP-binding protein [Flavobacterium sp.]|uniref:ATP-binding protein n=1 Tax=Flavobacterium sp. TaxID=239 RepID=UPI00375396BE